MRGRFVGLILLAVTAGLASGGGALAQAPSSPYPLLATPGSVARLVEAWNTQAPYVPGEVLVKFKSGAFGSAESRALSVLRGSVDNSTTRWAGDALIVATPDEPDAALAADRLAAQPEVEWAQPNYL